MPAKLSPKPALPTELPSVKKQVLDVTRPISQLPSVFNSLTHTKALFLFVVLAGKEVRAGQLYEVPIEVVRDTLRCRDDAHLAEELQRLDVKIVGEKWSPGKRGWIRFVPVCLWGDGVVQWEFSSHFVTLLEDRSRGWRTCDLEVIVSFRSLYALRLYLYLAPYVGGEKHVQPPALSTVDLKNILGVSQSTYSGDSAGQLAVELRRACREITEAKDGFKVSYKREGTRLISAWHHFILEEGPKQQRILLSGAGSAKPVSAKPAAIEDDQPRNAAIQQWLERHQ